MRIIFIALMMLVVGPTHADIIKRINNLISSGNHAYELSQRTRIRECADSAFALLSASRISANDSLDLAASIYKLYGNFHYENCTLDSAEYFYNVAQEIIDNHSDTGFKSLTRLLLLRDKAQLYYRKANYSLAAALLAKADDELEYNTPYLVNSDDWLITKLSYAMCLARIKNFDEAIAIAERELQDAINKSGISYVKAQRMYAKILMLAQVNETGALKAYKNYFEAQRKYALDNFANMNASQRSEYWQTLQPFIADCYQIEEADPAFLYDISLFSKGLLLHLSRLAGNEAASEDVLKTLTYKWSDIQKRLAPDCVAIEFVQYMKEDSQRMAALVLKPKGEPMFVPLTPPNQILELAGKDMQSTDRSTKDRLYENAELHALIWPEPLLSAIKGAKCVYFAPDGYLHRLAIEYMPQVQDLKLYRLTSTRRLMDRKVALQASAPALFFGGINYDFDKMPGGETDNDATAYSNYLGKRFPRLSDSTDETNSIYHARNNPADSVVTASYASENTFTALAPEYESILISSHGDFCSSTPISTDLKTVGTEATMSQNIIAFAGVNNYLRDRGFDATKHCDGLMSAKELSEMDLSRCKLFTVSACQSALGSISADGVFGLQRGLKNAGVQAMLLSLWNVSSEATCALMKTFYSKLNDGMSIAASFASARAEILSPDNVELQEETVYEFDPATMTMQPIGKATSRSFAAPQYSNAFILIDAFD